MLGIIFFVVGLYFAYEATVSWIVSPTQWNEGIVVAIALILALYAGYEYLQS